MVISFSLRQESSGQYLRVLEALGGFLPDLLYVGAVSRGVIPRTGR